jgi:PadR family transcriptional regulator AphA
MSTPPTLTTTSYAVLGLLAIKPWSSYELTQQMDRSLGRVWPRAASKLYEEPKKLVAHGLARPSTSRNGRRSRTVYTITEHGRRALGGWLAEPSAGPALESEHLLKAFFADHGSTADLLATLGGVSEWARARCAESLAIGQQYAEGEGPFPERMAVLQLTSRFLTDFYILLDDWAAWATLIAADWPDDPSEANHDPGAFAETIRRAAGHTAQRADLQSQRYDPHGNQGEGYMTEHTEAISKLLHEAGETHHRVYRIVDGDDADWASWYADWLINLSELPQLLGQRPVRSELVYMLVKLDKQYTAEGPGEPWEQYYARRIAKHFSAAA